MKDIDPSDLPGKGGEKFNIVIKKEWFPHESYGNMYEILLPEPVIVGNNTIRTLGALVDIANYYYEKSLNEEDSNILKAVTTFLKHREGIGKEKYNTSMDREDLSKEEWLQHLKEELADGLMYIQKLQSFDISKGFKKVCPVCKGLNTTNDGFACYNCNSELFRSQTKQM